MIIDAQTAWFIFFCVIIGIVEILWIKKIHSQNVIIKRHLEKLKAEENDFWTRWNWEPSPEEKAKLATECEESKRLIALYWGKHRESVRLSTILS